MLSSTIGGGGLLQETVPLVSREEVFAGQAAQEEEDIPWVTLPGRSAARCRVTPPSAGHPARAARLGNGAPGGTEPLGSSQDLAG